MKIVRISDLSEEERKKALEKQEERYQKNTAEREAEAQRVNKFFEEESKKQVVLPTSNKQENNSSNQRLLLPLLNKGETINIDNNMSDKLSNMSSGQRVAIIHSMTNNQKDFNKLNQETMQYQQQKEAEEKADKINEDMSNGKYGSAVGHILSGVPQKALDSSTTTFASMNSLVAPNKINATMADENELLKTNKILTSKYEQTTENIDNDIVKTASNVSGTIGGMVPSIVANVAMPGSGAIVQGVNVGADAYQETLNEDASNKAQATITGITKGIVSGLVEKITGGNIIGKGSLDDTVTNLIAKNFKGKVGQKLASKAYEIIGEIGEENLENQAGYIIDKIINGKDITAKEWWNEASETTKNTFLTTVVLNLLGLGGSTYNDVQNAELDLQAQKYIKEAEEIIKNENLQNNTSNLQQNQANNINNLQAQQITQKENKITQNRISEQINNNIANNQETLYNNNERESGINERYTRDIDEGRNRLYKEQKNEQNREYNWEEYNKWEQSIRTITKDNLTNSEQESINRAKTEYNKDVLLYDENNNDNKYSGGASQNVKNKITISRQQAEVFGLNNMIEHETVESDILHNDEARDILSPIIDLIQEDNSFNLQKDKFWEGQDGNIPSDSLIAKDIICDRFSEIKNGEKIDYDNVLNNSTNANIDMALINYYKQVYGKELEISSSFNLPTQNTTKTNVTPTAENNVLPTANKTMKEVGIPLINNEENTNKNIEYNLLIDERTKARKHYKSIIQSQYTTDEARKISKELMKTDTYVPESNNKQLERADKRIELSGADSELDSLMSRAMTGGNIKADDIAVGERLIQYYSKTGNKEKLQEAIQATAMAGTTAGQTVQAMSLLNHQTPEGQAVWLQRSVDKMNNHLVKERGEYAEQFTLTPEMTEKIVNSKDSEELQSNLNEVYKELGQQVTKTNLQKIDAWRYFSMLANPKTHIRNVVGNIAMSGIQSVKNKVAGTIEDVVNKFNPNMERNHTNLYKADKEMKQFAKSDIKNVADRLGLNENKYNPKTRLENSMRTFKSNAFENTIGKLFEVNNKLLEAEDGWGLKAGYTKALTDYMVANNLEPQTITDKQLAKARNYAIEQAQEATFHQASAISTLINQFSNKNKLTKFVMDATLPFKKTPVNVAKAGLEYSPVGLVKSAIYDTVQLRKGNITVNKYIDNVSKGLTGTGIALVGYALASAGILKASGSDDKDKESFDQDRGSQTYSIQIGDNTYTLDWLAPSGIPLFIGAECYEIMQTEKETKTSYSDEDSTYNQAVESATNILDAFTNAMNPMTEMSMLSGLTSALKSYDGDNSKMLANLGVNAVKSYVNQFIPTALGQVAKTTDEYERSTSSTKTGTLPKAIDSTKNYAMSKIPGLRQMLPTKTDVWGNELKQSDNVLQRALENSTFPWTRKGITTTDVDKELINVYNNTGESSVLPDSINKYLTINKEKYVMTSEEYAKYKQTYGTTSYNILNNLVKSSSYKKMNDSQKQYAIEKVYDYATEQIKIDYAKNNKLEYEESKLSKTVNEMKKCNVNVSNYFEYLALTEDTTKSSEKIEVLTNSNFSNKSKELIYENNLLSDTDGEYPIIKSTGLNINSYLKYKLADSNGEFASDKKDDGTVKGKTISGSAKNKKYNYIANMQGATYTQKAILYGLEYTPDKSDKLTIVNYISLLPGKTNKEKLDMLSEFSWITIYKDGTFDY